MNLDIETIKILDFLENLGYRVLYIEKVKDEIYVFIDKKVDKELVKAFGNKVFFYYVDNETNLIRRYFYNIFARNPQIIVSDEKLIVVHPVSKRFEYKFIPLRNFFKKVLNKELEIKNGIR